MGKVAKRVKQDADYIFHELTRSICPECKTVIDAQIIIRDNKVYMRKRCPTHGWFEGIISSDAEMYVNSIKFNKPGTNSAPRLKTAVRWTAVFAPSTSNTCAWNRLVFWPCEPPGKPLENTVAATYTCSL